jgi:outer membrane receptor protein involved in Fe transport
MRQQNVLIRSIAVALGSSAMVLASGTAFAQTPFEEITVTAQKREQSANEVGMAISAFAGDDLDTLGLTDTRDLAALVPGLTMAKSSSNTPIYTLRGIGFNTPNITSTSPVGVYVDEVSFPYPYMSQGLTFDIERVEVLKGPQGTLYGRNTTGGLVNYIVNRPTEEFEAYAQVEAGSYQQLGFEGVLSGGLSDTVSARISVGTRQSGEGWQESTSRGDKLGEIDRSAFRLLVDWAPSDTFGAEFAFGYWTDQSDSQAGQPINFNPEALTPENIQQLVDLGFAPDFATATIVAEALYVQPGLRDAILTNPRSHDADWAAANQPASWLGSTYTPRPDLFKIDAEMTSLSARFDWTLENGATISSLTGYADLERNDFIDRDGTQFEIVVFNDIGTVKSFSQELRIAGSGDRHEYVAGIYYSSDETSDTANPWAAQTSILNRLRVLVPAGAAAAGAPPEVVTEIAGGFRDWQNFSDIDTESIAVFGQFEFAISDALNLTIGARYTDDSADFTGCSRDRGNGNILALWNPAFGTAIPAGGCVTFENDFSAPVSVVTGTLDEDNVSGRLGLDWSASDNTMWYGSISRGFKSGAFPQLSGNVASQYDPATQEQVLAYEVGVKSSLADSSVQLNAAAYFYDYEDKQVFGEVLDPVFVTLTRLVNVPKSEVKGAELDITWFATDSFLTRIAVSWMNTEITEYVGFDKFANLVNFAGSEFEYSPELQVNALASYDFGLSDTLRARLTVDFSHTSDQQGDFLADPIFKVDSYQLLGLHFVVQPNSDKWEFAVFGRNLTDEYYWTSVQTQTDTTFRYAGMPLTWGASLKVNF